MNGLISVLENYPLAFIFFASIVGLMIGSFLNVVILRLPLILEYQWKKDFSEFNEVEFKETKPPSITYSRSHCPKCKNQLLASHNVPLISFLLLRGKCAFCKASISLRYPFIEALVALLTGYMAFRFGVSIQFIAAILLLWFLVVITWIDIDTYLIPDQLSLTLLWLGLFFSLFDHSISPGTAIIGALVGYLSLWLVFHIFKLITGKEGMGYGDFKLLAAGGAWLGFEALISVLLIASVAGLLFAVIQLAIKKGENKIPFGPYLSLGILLSYLTEGELLNWLILPS